MSREGVMETSTLMWAIAHNQLVQQRIEATVREIRWGGNEDPTASVPVDHLAWAVATDADIRDGVNSRLDGDQPDVAAACAGITDSELSPVVTAALERLG